MGQIIKLDTWSGELPAPLTETGSGGFLSRGYLGERPAREHVEGDETVQYVLTNRKRGITVDGETTTPDSRHRTVAVVTDRRLLVLVGGADSDTRFVTPLAQVADVDATVGRLTVELADGTTWHVPTDTDGLDDVVAYISTAATAWQAVDGNLDAVRATLLETRELRRAGEYEAAIETLRGAREELEAAWERADEFTSAHPGDALQGPPSTVESECRVAAAAIRVDRAREVTDIARDHCQAGDYDAAQTALVRARDEYEKALRVTEGTLDETERIAAERDRVADLVTELREAPLRQAITADKAGVEADDTATAADHWETALSRYQVALESEADGLNGDPAEIRERAGRIAEQLTAIQRSQATDAMQAGDWYADAGQHEAAIEEFERADGIFADALSTARTWYPDAVTHLEAERAAVTQRIERTRARLNGDEIDDRLGAAEDPTLAVGEVGDPATLGAPDAVAATVEPPTGIPSRAREQLVPDPATACLQNLDHEAVTEVVATALRERNWTTHAAGERTPFDLFATRDSERAGVIVAEDPVTPDRVEYCETVTGAAGTDSVLLVATDACAKPAARLADARGVRLLRSESLGAILDTAGVRLPKQR